MRVAMMSHCSCIRVHVSCMHHHVPDSSSSVSIFSFTPLSALKPSSPYPLYSHDYFQILLFQVLHDLRNNTRRCGASISHKSSS
jgi:hypothetical protein